LEVSKDGVNRKNTIVMNNNYTKYLPKGWIEVSLGEIITLEYGKSLTASQRKNGSCKVWGSNGIVGTHNDFLIEGPVIIVGRKGSVGAIHYAYENCWPIDTTYYINSIHSISSQFVYYLLKYIKLLDLDTSTTIPGLNRESVYTQKVLLPPLNEQYRIVEKIEELFSEIEHTEKTYLTYKNVWIFIGNGN
jgi:type I restriction enzyme S subunit